ncbi:MAG: glycosyltransferase family 39 protein [Anaerolineae bacterium]
MNKTRRLLLLAILFIGAALRLYKIASIPPGPSFDATFYGLDALEILRGARPVFMATNAGREALFSYLVAFFYLFTGPGGLGIYLSSALVGILTIPAVYLAASEVLADEDGVLRAWGPLAAALFVCVSYWHVQLSRQGVRAILVPLFTALVVYFLWRGLRTGRVAMFAACGVTLGLSMYSYQAIRLVPVLVVAAFVGVRLWRPGWPPAPWRNLALVLVLAAVVALPLAAYAVNHPTEFNQRVEDALVLNNPGESSSGLQALRDQVVDTLLMFSIRGNDSPIKNIPYHPGLDPFLSALFMLGIIIALLRIRRFPYAFLLFWLGVMMVPSMLAGLGAAEKRASATLPAVAILGAIGALVAWELVRRLLLRYTPWAVQPGVGLASLLLIGLVAAGLVTSYDYFVTFGSDGDLFTHFEAGQSAVGEYIGTLPQDELVYVDPIAAEHVGLQLSSNMRPDVRSYNGNVCLRFPSEAPNGATFIVVPEEDKYGLDTVETYFPKGEIAQVGPLHQTQPYFFAYHVPPGAQINVNPEVKVDANWAGKIRLLGYDLDAPNYDPGQEIDMNVYFEALDEMEANYTVFVHLLGPKNPATGDPMWAQSDSEPCERLVPTSTWHKGEIIQHRVRLPIPKDAPTADYRFEVGFYELETLERLPVVSASEGAKDNAVGLGNVAIGPY